MSFFSKLFGGGFDYAAQGQAMLQQQQATQRQNDIQNGTRSIDQVFGRFNDDFYNKRREAALNYYMPQADQQYNDAERQLTFALARSGGAQSSAAAAQRADLQKRMMAARQQIMDRADSSAQVLRNQVAGAHADLINMLNQSGNAATTADNARARVTALSMPETYGALPDLFSTGASIAGQQKALEDSFNASGGLTARPANWVFGTDQTTRKQPWQQTGAVSYS